jgi:hypothetical protein
MGDSWGSFGSFGRLRMLAERIAVCGVDAEGRHSHRTVFRRSGKHQGKIKYQKVKCKMTNQKSKIG